MLKTVESKALNDSYFYCEHPSGLKIYLMKKKGFSSCHAIFGTAYGSVDTLFSRNGGEPTAVPEGIAHFLEHKLFESEELDAFQLFSKTGAYANAYTSFDRTCYLFGCSSNLEENLKILLNFVQSPYFTKETVEKEQGIIGQEIEMYLDSPDWRVMFNLFGALYEKNPVRIDIAGTRKSIAEIDDKLLYECYNTFYNLSNMFLALVGDFDEDKILKLIDENLKPQEKVTFERFKTPEKAEVRTHYVEQKLAVSKPQFMLGFRDEQEGEYPPLRRRLAMELFLEILAGKASSLNRRLTESGDISSDLDFEYFYTRNAATALFAGESENYLEVKEKIFAEIERLRSEGIDPARFDAVKKAAFGERVMRFDSVKSIASMFVESFITGDDIFEAIETLGDITLSEVENCAAAFGEENHALSVILKNS